MVRVRVKVCCIASRDEADLAVKMGTDAIGLVSAMPSGPGPTDERLIRQIADHLPPPVASFLLTSQTSAHAIADQIRRCRPSVVQLVDWVEPQVICALREIEFGVRFVQVVHVEDDSAIEAALLAAAEADAVLLDSGRPSLAVPELGGTGRTHDWEISAEIVRRLAKPVFLAGGLHADNVAEAVRHVRPYAVDVCSGVRREGRLDGKRLGDFVQAVSAAQA